MCIRYSFGCKSGFVQAYIYIYRGGDRDTRRRVENMENMRSTTGRRGGEEERKEGECEEDQRGENRSEKGEE